MRTTLDLPEAVWRAGRERAARDGTTLTAVVTAALQRYLVAARAEPYRLEWEPVGRGGVLPGVDLGNRSGLYDLMDGVDGQPVTRLRGMMPAKRRAAAKGGRG